jgi:hypothetical protein
VLVCYVSVRTCLIVFNRFSLPMLAEKNKYLIAFVHWIIKLDCLLQGVGLLEWFKNAIQNTRLEHNEYVYN